jgi:hypothetical protein
MPTTSLRYAMRGFWIVAVLTVSFKIVLACSCGPKPTVLDSYEWADAVVIVRVISVDKVDEKAFPHRYVDNVRSTTAIVVKVYKGNLRARDEIVFGQGGGADCIWTFNEKFIGSELLFYLKAPETGTLWYAGGCGRSKGVAGATEDLMYLNNLDKRRGKTRVSGSLGDWNSHDFPIAGKKIRIVGEKKTYETKTDDEGVYEIYDMPAGRYRLEPEMPKGWRIARSWLRYVAGISPEQDSTQSVSFSLEDKKHVSIDVSFEPDNAVEGSVVDADGNAMSGVCVYLWKPDQSKIFGPSDCTDEKGRFRIESFTANSYHLVVNRDGRPSSREPFPQVFYPGVTEREKAALITVVDGEVVKGINVVIPRLVETVTVEGVLLYSDDKPVVDNRVQFKTTSPDVNGDVSEYTNKEGRFRLKLVKGVKGVLSSDFYASIGRFEDCAKLDSLVKETGQRFAAIKTEDITIEAIQDIADVQLKFPFPMCKKKE